MNRYPSLGVHPILSSWQNKRTPHCITRNNQYFISQNRSAILLFYHEQFSLQQVANRLNISVGAVKVVYTNLVIN